MNFAGLIVFSLNSLAIGFGIDNETNKAKRIFKKAMFFFSCILVLASCFLD